jgi:hypothetical protein
MPETSIAREETINLEDCSKDFCAEALLIRRPKIILDVG